MTSELFYFYWIVTIILVRVFFFENVQITQLEFKQKVFRENMYLTIAYVQIYVEGFTGEYKMNSHVLYIQEMTAFMKI